ncbi:hypothetical protein CSOJ01_12218 [Colletotrichum sojae]|uniref:2OG-Fe dioxygenase family protein n=1 Tax=Colletotrichum sojae TaxID=2175907 RepID=A0A8H6IVL6_9PEZI|nr:hypothetical protein CSOJ01_12218 [Colletotrichum sojae]
MTRCLTGLGATGEDLKSIQTVSDGLRGDPTLPFRKTTNGRFLIDFDRNDLRRLEFQEFILSATEDFALFLFKALMIRGIETHHRPVLDYDLNLCFCTLFNPRTVTTGDLVGEPALEGLHSDGVEFTMTTFLGAENITDDSATTFVYDNAEKTGARWHETDPELLRGQQQHRHLMNTLLFADAERKHSLMAVEREDPSRDATRDMLIFFTRKPVVSGHVSSKYDSLIDHKTLTLRVPLKEVE